ncbi:hypothetical protein ACH5RR_036293 [Cinchona calisaya]|uniref:NAC domain-containing protein n=1 Tax=Cinchona calisaya TaxID=153742 RepID=A0ABD2Y7G7_9GENT
MAVEDAPAIGFRFRPTEQELLYLLLIKAAENDFQIDEVEDKTLYGEDAAPWQVFRDDDHWLTFDDCGNGRKKILYAFTKLTKLSPNKVARIAGSGTWDGETKKTEILDFSGQIIGTKKMLSYVLNSGSALKGGWIMHEYSLAGAFLNQITSTDYVLCRIIWEDSKNTKVKVPARKRVTAVASAAHGDQVQGSCSENYTTDSQVLGKRSKPSFQESNSQSTKKLAMVTNEAASNDLVNNNMPKVIDLGSKRVAAQEGSGEVQASNMGCSQNPTTNPQDPSFQEFTNDAMNNNLWLPEENNPLAAIVPDHDHNAVNNNLWVPDENNPLAAIVPDHDHEEEHHHDQNYLDYYLETDGWMLP